MPLRLEAPLPLPPHKFKLAPESHRPKLLSINAGGELIKALPFAKLLRAVPGDFCTYSIPVPTCSTRTEIIRRTMHSTTNKSAMAESADR